MIGEVMQRSYLTNYAPYIMWQAVNSMRLAKVQNSTMARARIKSHNNKFSQVFQTTFALQKVIKVQFFWLNANPF